MSLDQPNAFVKHQSVTRDAFLGGRITLSQPSHGFRAGLDSVLLGAAVGRERKTLLDLGSGVGTAAYVALTHNPELTAVLAEQDAETVALARANAEANGFAARVTCIQADVIAKGEQRHSDGLRQNSFDCVIANPPFFTHGTLAADRGRAGARHMDAALLDLWIKTAAGCCAAGGEIIFIFPIAGLPALLAGVTQRFGSVTALPLLPRPEQPASRILIRGIAGSRTPMTLLAGRAMHGTNGRDFTAEFDAIFRGEGRLDW